MSGLVNGLQRTRSISIKRQVEQAVTANRQRPVGAGGSGRDKLDARTVGEHRREKRPFAADSLVADPSDLFREALKQRIVDLGRLMAGHAAALLNPDLTRPIDQDLGNIRLREPSMERLEISLEKRVDAAGSRKLFGFAHPFAP